MVITGTAVGPTRRRVAWVTGAGTGIGRGVAKRLAQDGWLVAASARTLEDLTTLAAEVPGQIIPVQVDVSDEAAVLEAAQNIERDIGTIDMLVASAGTYKRLSATNFKPAAFRQMIDVNIMGSVNCLGALLPKMIARRGGHIAVIASVAGYVGLPSAAAYGATKAALINMCEALKPELDVHNVKLTLINPGFVDTPLTKKNDFPMPFMIPVDEAVGHIVKGLASDRFEVVFPWQMNIAMKLLGIVPHWLLFAVTRRMVR